MEWNVHIWHGTIMFPNHHPYMGGVEMNFQFQFCFAINWVKFQLYRDVRFANPPSIWYFFGDWAPSSTPPTWEWSLSNMGFLCTSPHFMQFLVKQFFWKLTPITPNRDVDQKTWHFSVDLVISFNSWEETLSWKLTTTPGLSPPWGGGCKIWFFCADLDNSVLTKNIFCIWPPLNMGGD